jgi:hypothetical protein
MMYHIKTRKPRRRERSLLNAQSFTFALSNVNTEAFHIIGVILYIRET